MSCTLDLFLTNFSISESRGELAKTQMAGPTLLEVWGGTRGFAFLTSSQKLLLLLQLDQLLHFRSHRYRRNWSVFSYFSTSFSAPTTLSEAQISPI